LITGFKKKKEEKRKLKKNSFSINHHLNVKLYTIFNILFIVIFFYQNNLHKQTAIFDFEIEYFGLLVGLE
jgi:hypothetical protein